MTQSIEEAAREIAKNTGIDIVFDICSLENNPFEGMSDDDVWISLNDLGVILDRNIETAIAEAEQRGIKLGREQAAEEVEICAVKFVSIDRPKQAEGCVLAAKLIRSLP